MPENVREVMKGRHSFYEVVPYYLIAEEGTQGFLRLVFLNTEKHFEPDAMLPIRIRHGWPRPAGRVVRRASWE